MESWSSEIDYVLTLSAWWYYELDKSLNHVSKRSSVFKSTIDLIRKTLNMFLCLSQNVFMTLTKWFCWKCRYGYMMFPVGFLQISHCWHTKPKKYCIHTLMPSEVWQWNSIISSKIQNSMKIRLKCIQNILWNSLHLICKHLVRMVQNFFIKSSQYQKPITKDKI